jgi:hypothetical protein
MLARADLASASSCWAFADSVAASYLLAMTGSFLLVPS